MSFFSSLFTKQPEPEERAYPPGWMIPLLEAGGTSSSGVSVTVPTAMRWTVFYAAVDLISNSVAQMPLHIYRRKADGSRERMTGHPYYRLLHSEPNDQQSAFDFWKVEQVGALTWGNGYAEIERDGAGLAKAFWPLPPNKMQVKRTEAGELVYVQKNDAGQIVAELPAINVLHGHALGDGFVGMSPVAQFREAIGLGMAAEKFGGAFFGNNANPSGVLSLPGKLGQPALDRLRESWMKLHGGPGNMGKPAILEQEMKWTPMTVPPEDAQFLETRQFQVVDMCRVFHIPPHKLQDLLRATFCLPADAEVYTEDGPKSIAAVQAGEMVWSRHPDNKWALAPVIRSVKTGRDPILHIRTTNRSLRLNARHRVMVRRKGHGLRRGSGGYQTVIWRSDWLPAGELKVGDTLIAADGLPGGQRLAPTRPATVEFMEFCGLYLGDGNMMRQGGKPSGLSISRAGHAGYMDHYRGSMRALFTKRVSPCGVGSAAVVLQEAERCTRFSSVDAGAEMAELGFSGTAHTKSVPGWVFTLDDDLRLAFLRGYLDADGSVDKKGRISYSSCNEKMLSQARHLCMGLGIPVTNLRCQRGVTTLPNGEPADYAQYCFTCSDPGQNRRIGSHDPRYTARFAAGRPFGRKGRKYPRHGGRDFGMTGCSLTRITSITPEPAEDVYDLEVAGTHCFIANGLVVHNSNIEHQAIEYVQDCLGPWLVNWEQELNRKLFGTKAQSQFYAEFLTEGLLRGDVKTRSLFYRQMFGIGVMTQNEIRQRENLPPIAGGDEPWMPVNMAPVSAHPAFKEPEPAPEPAPDAPDKDEPDGDSDRGRIVAAHRALLMEACGRIVRREIGAMRKAAKRFTTFKASAEHFYKTQPGHIADVLCAAVAAYAAAMGNGDTTAYMVEVAELWSEQARTRLQNVAERRLPALLGEWEAKRPREMTERILGDFNNARP